MTFQRVAASITTLDRGRTSAARPPAAEPAEALATLVTLPRGRRDVAEFEWGAAFQRLGTLGSLAEGWNGGHARAPGGHTIQFVAEVLARLKQAGVPAPAINPAADGAIHAHWHAQGVDVEMIVDAPYEIMALIDDARGELASFEGDDNELRETFNGLQVMVGRRDVAARQIMRG